MPGSIPKRCQCTFVSYGGEIFTAEAKKVRPKRLSRLERKVIIKIYGGVKVGKYMKIRYNSDLNDILPSAYISDINLAN